MKAKRIKSSPEKIEDAIIEIQGVTGVEFGSLSYIGAKSTIKIQVSRSLISDSDFRLIRRLLNDQNQFDWTIDFTE